ncbi:MAG TPA: hypothetical protein DEP72_00295 [Clostridiales bacterium]|nr:MAG: hypothetical protein A2Y18_00880 [Clostridiales bacterium GWD2_32_19]HCC06591.1 hypothetical protein [Clostridiales bacterium]
MHKLFYKPEEVIQQNVILNQGETKFTNKHMLMLIFSIAFTVINVGLIAHSKSVNLIFTPHVIFRGISDVIILLIIGSYILNIITSIVVCKSQTYKESTIIQIYLLFPVVIVNLFFNVMALLSELIARDNTDIYINLLMSIGVFWIIVAVYFIYLNIKVIRVVKDIYFYWDMPRYFLFIGVSIFVLIGNIDLISSGLNSESREAIKSDINISSFINK